ncbi:MAG TPA: hypothetical protein VJV96_08600 [Candidatus Angelobacter sp.]|jgi:hypothetical protein|nr:hypothetical protein [Candidatus Angelobacter sp.]
MADSFSTKAYCESPHSAVITITLHLARSFDRKWYARETQEIAGVQHSPASTTAGLLNAQSVQDKAQS